LQLSQKHPSKEHCKLFLSSKPFNFLNHTSDFPTSYKGQGKESEKITNILGSFSSVKNTLLGGHEQCPLEKQFPNFKRDHTGGKGERDKK